MSRTHDRRGPAQAGRPGTRGAPRLGLVGLLALMAGPGCGGEPSPLSPLPEQDPARHARAVSEMEDVARRNQEAEARFMRRVSARPAFPNLRIADLPGRNPRHP